MKGVPPVFFSSVKHEFRFVRIVATLAVVLLLLGTAADTRADSGDPVSQFLSQLETIIFGTQSSSSTSPQTSDSTRTSSVDPTPNPPPPTN